MSDIIQHNSLGRLRILISYEDAKTSKSIALVESINTYRYSKSNAILRDNYVLYSNTNDLTACGFTKMTYDSGKRMSLSVAIKRFHNIKNALEFVNFSQL